MNIFQKLTEKPWLANDDLALEGNSESLSSSSQVNTSMPAKTALYFFLSVVSVLFLLFTITFLSRSQAVDFQALAGEPWLPFSQPNSLWFNTGALVLASISLQLAVLFARQQKTSNLLITLVLATIFSATFLIGQFSVWQQLTLNGYALNQNPANSFFYLLTGIHGLHLLGGIFALVRVVWIYWKKSDTQSLTYSLKLCTTYWHYLLIVWLFLFALLTATPETYRTIALFCGF